MWRRSRVPIGGTHGFFFVAMCYNSLENYYHTNFSLMQHHKYSLSDVENLMPFERDIYVGFLIAYIEKENARIEQEQQMAKTRRR